MSRSTIHDGKTTYPGRDREADLLKLLDAFVERLEWQDCEYGGWEIDPKRPFGNSGATQIHRDICGIIGLEINERPCPHCGEAIVVEAILGEPLPDWGAYAAGLYRDIGEGMALHWKRLRASAGPQS